MKQEGTLVSVIVPIYSIDRFIGHCVESIIDQSYQNLEIILVDDGSPDRCPEICDLYAEKDDRIVVIHKPNGGIVSARKAGLAASHGEYITYVDGDDWIGPGHIGSMLAVAEATDSDIVCVGFTRNFFSNKIAVTNPYPSGIYEGEELTKLWSSMLSYGEFHRFGIFTYVWNKLFRREVLLDVQNSVDERISIGEDAAVAYPALLKCERVAVTDSVAYHYRQREDSMLKQSTNYAAEAQKLKYLYDYMLAWSETTPSELNLRSQVIDAVLSMAIIRSGGRLPHFDYSTTERSYRDKKIVLYSAGTFGQQVYTRTKESDLCEIVAWVDDYYREYRRVCRDVDPVDVIADLEFDYIFIASVDPLAAEDITLRLLDMGISRDKILAIKRMQIRKEELLSAFMDVEAIRAAENK